MSSAWLCKIACKYISVKQLAKKIRVNCMCSSYAQVVIYAFVSCSVIQSISSSWGKYFQSQTSSLIMTFVI